LSAFRAVEGLPRQQDLPMQTVRLSHAAFAVTLVCYGIYGLIQGEFTPPWQDAPKSTPMREGLVYLGNIVSIVAGGLLWSRTQTIAARVLFVATLLWLLLIKLRYIILAPTTEGSYQTCGETAVVVAAAWALYVEYATAWDRRRLAFVAGPTGLRASWILYGLALIAFGLSHFFYMELTAPLIPDWLPWHEGWAYFTGVAYALAGIAIVVGVLARWAAILVAIQIALITFIVWPPLALSHKMTAFQWGEFITSWLLTAAAWIVADSYRGRNDHKTPA
jgi:uncharacterized membrane protein